MKISTLAPMLGLLASVTSANTWTVAPVIDPGVDFTSIQAAIDAASDGDLILVESGSYLEQLHVDGKGLTLQGFGNTTLFGTAATLTAQPLVHVENLAPGQEFHLRDFSVNRITGVWGEAIRLEDSGGRVWLEQVFVDSYDGHCLRVIDCADVLLSEVFLQANAAFQDALGNNLPAHGLIVEAGSSVQAFQLDSIGSHGPPIFVTPTIPVPGGNAARVIDSSLRMIAPQLQGGGGGSVFLGGCSTGAIGGSVLVVQARGGPAPAVEMRAGTLYPGISDQFTPGCASDPGTPPVIDAPAGSVTQLAGVPRLLSMPTLPYPNGNFEFQVQGAGSDLYFLFGSTGTAPALPLGGIDGDFLIDAGTLFLAASGQLSATGWGAQTAGFVNPGPPKTLRTQALFLDLSGALWLSGPGTILFP